MPYTGTRTPERLAHTRRHVLLELHEFEFQIDAKANRLAAFEYSQRGNVPVESRIARALLFRAFFRRRLLPDISRPARPATDEDFRSD